MKKTLHLRGTWVFFGNLCSQQVVSSLQLYLAPVTNIILSPISVLGVLITSLSCQAQDSA